VEEGLRGGGGALVERETVRVREERDEQREEMGIRSSIYTAI